MTKAHVEKFSEVLLSDPDMSEKLGLSKFLDTLETNDSEAQATSKATFVDNAVKEATSRGLIFSKEEFIENVDVEVLAMQSGELSDLQLESVAGGGRKRDSHTRYLLRKSDARVAAHRAAAMHWSNNPVSSKPGG